MNNTSESIFNQAAVFPLRRHRGRLQVLLINNRSRSRMIIPKGIIENGDSPIETARKEALEEAGIEGIVFHESVGHYSYTKWDGICRVEVFMMKVDIIHDRWPESAFRNRQWLPIESALTVMDSRIPAELRKRLSGMADDYL